MKTAPILFSTEMVRAILEGRKTQTRREIKQVTVDECGGVSYKFKNASGRLLDPVHLNCHFLGILNYSPYGKVGDVLWVRETHCYVSIEHAHDLLEGSKDRNQFVYKTGVHPDWMLYAKEKYGYKWKPSIFMPKEVCRIWLRITDIKVERLQDISEMDALAEGVHTEKIPNGKTEEKVYGNYNLKGDDAPYYFRPTHSFQSLWQSINGPDSWEANPYVWAITFERIEKPHTL